MTVTSRPQRCRGVSVTAGFYQTCVIDGLLEHSPAEHVRRPGVPAESPTLGFTHWHVRSFYIRGPEFFRVGQAGAAAQITAASMTV